MSSLRSKQMKHYNSEPEVVNINSHRLNGNKLPEKKSSNMRRAKWLSAMVFAGVGLFGYIKTTESVDKARANATIAIALGNSGISNVENINATNSEGTTGIVEINVSPNKDTYCPVSMYYNYNKGPELSLKYTTASGATISNNVDGITNSATQIEADKNIYLLLSKPDSKNTICYAPTSSNTSNVAKKS